MGKKQTSRKSLHYSRKEEKIDIFAKALLLGLKIIDGKIEIDNFEIALKFIHRPVWLQCSISEDGMIAGHWYSAGKIASFDMFDDDLRTDGGWVGCLPFRVDPQVAEEALSRETPKRTMKLYENMKAHFRKM